MFLFKTFFCLFVLVQSLSYIKSISARPSPLMSSLFGKGNSLKIRNEQGEKVSIPSMVGWKIKEPSSEPSTVETDGVNLGHRVGTTTIIRLQLLQTKEKLVNEQENSAPINWLQNNINKIVKKGDRESQRGVIQFIEQWLKYRREHQNQDPDAEMLETWFKEHLQNSWNGIKPQRKKPSDQGSTSTSQTTAVGPSLSQSNNPRKGVEQYHESYDDTFVDRPGRLY